MMQALRLHTYSNHPDTSTAEQRLRQLTSCLTHLPITEHANQLTPFMGTVDHLNFPQLVVELLKQ